MLPLFLTILCSTIITLLLKHNNEKKGNPVVLLMGNYFIAFTVCLFLLFLTSNTTYSIFTFVFGVLLAFMFVFSFFAFTKAVSVAGAALACVRARLSVVIPIIFSMLFFYEQANYVQFIGFLFTFFAFLLFYFSLKGKSATKAKIKEYAYLIFLLLGIGSNDFCMKIFEQKRPETDTPFFLFVIFFFAFLYTLAFVLLKRIRVKWDTVVLGAILGVPNIFSSFFLLGALVQLPAIIVYPVTNIGIILLTTLGAAIIWKEKFNVFGKWALIVGTTAIFLLSV